MSFKKNFSTFMGGLFKPSTEKPAGAPSTAPAPQPAEASPVPPEPETFWWDDLPEVPLTPAGKLELDEAAICDQLETAMAQGTFRMVDIPANVFRCLEILNQPDFAFSQVEDLISRSPVLAANVITIANSSLYSRGSKITKLSVALPRLGCGKIKAILYFASCERQLSNHPIFSQVATQIVTHSHVVAQVADYLSYRYYPDPDKAFLGGLLHDVGKLALLKELASSVSLSPAAGNDLTEESYGSLLTDLHERVGGMVARHWDLNPQITAVIAHHHDLDVFDDLENSDLEMQLAKLINISDVIARLLGYGRPHNAVNLPALVESLALEVSWDEQTSNYFQKIPEMLSRHD